MHALFLRLVIHEGEELRERPAMELPSGLHVLAAVAASDVGCFADVLEVLEHDGCPCGHALHNAFGEHVITIPVEPRLLSSQFLEVTPGAFTRQWIAVFF
jgi:hypothetical protein